MNFQIYKYNLVGMLGRKIKMDFDARFVNSLGFLHNRAMVEILKSILEMSAHFPSSGPHPLWVRNHKREGEYSFAIWS